MARRRIGAFGSRDSSVVGLLLVEQERQHFAHFIGRLHDGAERVLVVLLDIAPAVAGAVAQSIQVHEHGRSQVGRGLLVRVLATLELPSHHPLVGCMGHFVEEYSRVFRAQCDARPIGLAVTQAAILGRGIGHIHA